jgi:exodeoxyribonuclease VII large subunit
MAKAARSQNNVAEFTVSEISAALRSVVEDRFGYVRVRGEISGFRGAHSSGHAYFALKDDKARIEAVIWRSTLPRLRFKPEEGIEVIATGKLTTFPGASKYQIVIEALEPAGVGALMALLDERRKKLAAEGLFAEARKKPLPYLPRVIGVVTSPTGAVIRDILHRLDDRFPVRVVLWPVKVQGETAAAEVAAAIRGFNALPPGGPVPRPDVLIVARGGGSLEDLWSFNEEIVVRAAAESAIPLIAAIGHETDVTLIDHAADRRAPTPTAAAEMAVPVRVELTATLDGLTARQNGAIARLIAAGRRELIAAARALPDADDLLANPRRMVDMLAAQEQAAVGRLIEARRRDLAAAARALPRAERLLVMPRRMFAELSGRLGRGLHANAHLHRVHFERSAARLSLSRLRLLTERAGDRLHNLSNRERRAYRAILDRRRAAFGQVATQLRPGTITNRLLPHGRRLADIEAAAKRALKRQIADGRARLASLDQLLRTLSYRSVLARGFALVRSGGEPVHGASSVATGAALEIEFHDGHISAVATSGSASRRTPRKPAPTTGGQGSLF